MAKKAKAAGIRVEIDTEKQCFTLLVKQGENVLDSQTFSPVLLPENIMAEVELRGTATVLQQRASDADTAIEKLAEIREVWTMWLDGKYRKDRVVGARTIPAIIEVLAKVKGASPAAVQKAWAKLDETGRKPYLEKFADEIILVEEERKEADVELEDLL